MSKYETYDWLSNKPWRWTSFRAGVRSLLMTHGHSIDEVKDMVLESIKKTDQPKHLAALNAADRFAEIDEVARRCGKLETEV